MSVLQNVHHDDRCLVKKYGRVSQARDWEEAIMGFEAKKGFVALVTGASRGIGASIAEEYARHGCKLILTARAEDKLREVAQRCKVAGAVEVHVERCDLADRASIEALADKVIRDHGGVDVLVNNAGMSKGGSDVLSGEPTGWAAMVDVNVFAPQLLTLRLAPHMKGRQGAAVIFVGSLAGYRPTKSAAYGATKFAIRGFAFACYEQLREIGVKVLVIEPGYVETDMTASVEGNHSRFIQPKDVAEAAMLPFTTSATCCPLEVTLRLVLPVE